MLVGSEQNCVKVSTSLAGQPAHIVTVEAKYGTLFLAKPCDLCVLTCQTQAC